MIYTTVIMASFAVILSAAALIRGGPPMLLDGLIIGLKNMLVVIPLLLGAFTTAGMIQVLISRETVKKWLGREAGIKGVLVGALAGGIIPGGPYVFLPIAASFFMGGAEVGAVLAFITAKNLWSVTRIPVEIALLGTRITFVRYATTFIFPVLVGVLGNIFYSRFSDSIRQKIEERIT